MRLIAREAALEKRADDVFSHHEAIMGRAETGLDNVESKLALLSNDPLPASLASPLPPPPVLAPSRPHWLMTAR
jgi:hypothetical protein